jgi:hypothetical protein
MQIGSAPRPRPQAAALTGLTLLTALGALATFAPAQAATQAVSPKQEVFVHAAGRAGAGWQGAFTYAVPQGSSGLFFHYGCPATTLVENGGFAFNSVGQAQDYPLTFNGPRLDENPAFFGEWGWGFNFPGGAPANMTITFDVRCVKK